MKKLILIAILVLVVGGLLLAWQNFLTKEKVEHPTITEKKYFACLDICEATTPTPSVERQVCSASCREKYGISLPLLPELE